MAVAVVVRPAPAWLVLASAQVLVAADRLPVEAAESVAAAEQAATAVLTQVASTSARLASLSVRVRVLGRVAAWASMAVALAWDRLVLAAVSVRMRDPASGR